MSKRFIVGLAGVLLLALVPRAASAVCISGTVSPGNQVCIQSQFATTFAQAMGSGHNRNVRFTVTWSPNAFPRTWVTIYDETALAFTAVWGPTSSPPRLPGYFIACVKRPASHTNPADFDLCMDVE